MGDVMGLGPLASHEPLVDQVVRSLAEYIRLNRLEPGARLPTTAQMATSFGVAPTTLREALRRLEAAGTLTVRHGVGIFVKSDVGRLVVPNRDRTTKDRRRLVWLVEARQLIEPTLAGWAAERHTHQDFAELKGLLEKAADLRADRALAGPINLQFHARVARTAGNQVLSDTLAAILEIHVGDQLVIDRLFDDPERDHAEHVGILDAIGSRDGIRATRLMQSHLEEVLASVMRAKSDVNASPAAQTREEHPA